MVPVAILLMAYLILPELADGSESHYSLFTLSAVSVILTPWSFLAWLLFEAVDRWPEPEHERLGPLMESLAMLFCSCSLH